MATNDKDRLDHDNSQTKKGMNYSIGKNCLHITIAENILLL